MKQFLNRSTKYVQYCKLFDACSYSAGYSNFLNNSLYLVTTPNGMRAAFVILLLGKFATGLQYNLEYVSVRKIKDCIFPTGVFRKFRKLNKKSGNFFREGNMKLKAISNAKSSTGILSEK
jgi:hypothetical protein